MQQCDTLIHIYFAFTLNKERNHWIMFFFCVNFAADLGDYEDGADVETVIKQPHLLPNAAHQHTEEIVQEYKTLRSAGFLSFLSILIIQR